MRIRSLILALIAFVMSGGVILLTLSVVLLTAISHVEHESGTSSKDYQHTAVLVRNSQELLAMLDILTSESSGAFVLAERLSQRCREDIRLVMASPNYEQSYAGDDLEELMDEALIRAAGVQYADDVDGALELYDEAANRYLNEVEEIQVRSELLAKGDVLRVRQQRRLTTITLIVAALIYVCLVAIVFRGMSQRLVIPVQQLAGAAERSMRLNEPFQLEPNGPKEVHALTETVGAFVASLESKVAERTRALRESENKSQTLLERSPVCVKVIDLDSRLQFMSAAGVALLKIPDITARYGTVYPPTSYPESMRTPLTEHLDQALAGATTSVESPVLDMEGHQLWFHTTFVPVCDDAGQIEYVIATSVDITERKEMEENLRDGHASMARALQRETQAISELGAVNKKLEQLASTDRLTGLPNRTFFHIHLDQALKQSRRDGSRFAVLFFDFDRFKVINDSLGHDVGDSLLCNIAEIFGTELRESDAVARFGGDEFVVLLNSLTNWSDALVKAQRLLDAFAKPHQVNDHLISSSASIGLVTNERAYAQPGDMIRDADAAMYQAKDKGRAQVVVFDETMHANALDRLALEADLHHALDHDQLRLVYQPIVELDTGNISGFEALVRWDHPERGTISPLEFIPIAEETGLIVPIGRWIFCTAAAQIIDWNQKYGHERLIKVNVNVSKRQLLDSEFLDDVLKCQAELGLRPGELQIEITESTIADQRSDVAPLLRELRSHGIPIALDDFGTGVSSLSTLHEFPIDVLKIDQAFIRVLDHDRSLLAVVASINSLAENLGIQTVAEGIETIDVVGALQSIGCTWGQGYYFGRPLDVADAEEYLSQHLQSRKLPAA